MARDFLTFRLPPVLKEKLQDEAASLGISVSQYLRLCFAADIRNPQATFVRQPSRADITVTRASGEPVTLGTLASVCDGRPDGRTAMPAVYGGRAEFDYA